MGYFANSTEAAYYEEKYCAKCANYNDGTCAVLLLHMLWGYDALDDEEKSMALGVFIPRSSDGLSNKKCTMYSAARPGA